MQHPCNLWLYCNYINLMLYITNATKCLQVCSQTCVQYISTILCISSCNKYFMWIYNDNANDRCIQCSQFTAGHHCHETAQVSWLLVNCLSFVATNSSHALQRPPSWLIHHTRLCLQNVVIEWYSNKKKQIVPAASPVSYLRAEQFNVAKSVLHSNAQKC